MERTTETRDYAQIARSTTLTLFISQSLGSVAMIMSGTISTIVGAQLSGNPTLAGAPNAVRSLGAAAAAFALGAIMARAGRRWGMAIGIAAGIFGYGLAVYAITSGIFVIFLLGLALAGAAQASAQLGRFAAAEVSPPGSRGRAISYVVLGGTVGSVIGPRLVSPAGQWALTQSMDELAGPYVLGAFILLLSTLNIFFRLKPDPRDIGREVAELHAVEEVDSGSARSLSELLSSGSVVVAVAAMVTGQMVMVMLMGMTSLHMSDHAHSLNDIGYVFSAHTLGMFAFSVVTGKLTDLWGRGPVILAGAAMLVLSGFIAPLSPQVLPLGIALFLLGLGWNFCFVGGSALLADQLSPAERASTQGTNDLFIGLASAGSSFTGGVLFGTVGYTVMGFIGAAVSTALFLLVATWVLRQRRLRPLATP